MKQRTFKIDGIEVQDARKPLLLHIRDADTKTGKKDPSNCAAAKAAGRTKGVLAARVFRSRTYLLKTHPAKPDQKIWERYITPAALKGEIIAFDRGGSFEPDDYELIAPPKSMKLGTDQRRGRKNKPMGVLKRPSHTIKNIRPMGPGRPQ